MNERDLMRLTIETGISLSTVRKWARGGIVNLANSQTLTFAAKKLGLTGPDAVDTPKRLEG